MTSTPTLGQSFVFGTIKQQKSCVPSTTTSSPFAAVVNSNNSKCPIPPPLPCETPVLQKKHSEKLNTAATHALVSDQQQQLQEGCLVDIDHQLESCCREKNLSTSTEVMEDEVEVLLSTSTTDCSTASFTHSLSPKGDRMDHFKTISSSPTKKKMSSPPPSVAHQLSTTTPSPKKSQPIAIRNNTKKIQQTQRSQLNRSHNPTNNSNKLRSSSSSLSSSSTTTVGPTFGKLTANVEASQVVQKLQQSLFSSYGVIPSSPQVEEVLSTDEAEEEEEVTPRAPPRAPPPPPDDVTTTTALATTTRNQPASGGLHLEVANDNYDEEEDSDFEQDLDDLTEQFKELSTGNPLIRCLVNPHSPESETMIKTLVTNLPVYYQRIHDDFASCKAWIAELKCLAQQGEIEHEETLALLKVIDAQLEEKVDECSKSLAELERDVLQLNSTNEKLSLLQVPLEDLTKTGVVTTGFLTAAAAAVTSDTTDVFATNNASIVCSSSSSTQLAVPTPPPPPAVLSIFDEAARSSNTLRELENKGYLDSLSQNKYASPLLSHQRKKNSLLEEIKDLDRQMRCALESYEKKRVDLLLTKRNLEMLIRSKKSQARFKVVVLKENRDRLLRQNDSFQSRNRIEFMEVLEKLGRRYYTLMKLLNCEKYQKLPTTITAATSTTPSLLSSSATSTSSTATTEKNSDRTDEEELQAVFSALRLSQRTENIRNRAVKGINALVSFTRCVLLPFSAMLYEDGTPNFRQFLTLRQSSGSGKNKKQQKDVSGEDPRGSSDLVTTEEPPLSSTSDDNHHHHYPDLPLYKDGDQSIIDYLSFVRKKLRPQYASFDVAIDLAIQCQKIRKIKRGFEENRFNFEVPEFPELLIIDSDQDYEAVLKSKLDSLSEQLTKIPTTSSTSNPSAPLVRPRALVSSLREDLMSDGDSLDCDLQQPPNKYQKGVNDTNVGDKGKSIRNILPSLSTNSSRPPLPSAPAPDYGCLPDLTNSNFQHPHDRVRITEDDIEKDSTPAATTRRGRPPGSAHANTTARAKEGVGSGGTETAAAATETAKRKKKLTLEEIELYTDELKTTLSELKTKLLDFRADYLRHARTFNPRNVADFLEMKQSREKYGLVVVSMDDWVSNGDDFETTVKEFVNLDVKNSNPNTTTGATAAAADGDILQTPSLVPIQRLDTCPSLMAETTDSRLIFDLKVKENPLRGANQHGIRQKETSGSRISILPDLTFKTFTTYVPQSEILCTSQLNGYASDFLLPQRNQLTSQASEYTMPVKFFWKDHCGLDGDHHHHQMLELFSNPSPSVRNSGLNMRQATCEMIVAYIEDTRVCVDLQRISRKILYKIHAAVMEFAKLQENVDVTEDPEAMNRFLENKEKFSECLLNAASGITDAELDEYARLKYHLRETRLSQITSLTAEKRHGTNDLPVENQYLTVSPFAHLGDGSLAEFHETLQWSNEHLVFLRDFTPSALNPMQGESHHSLVRKEFVENIKNFYNAWMKRRSGVPAPAPATRTRAARSDRNENAWKEQLERRVKEQRVNEGTRQKATRHRVKGEKNQKTRKTCPDGMGNSDQKGDVHNGWMVNENTPDVAFHQLSHAPPAWALRACCKVPWIVATGMLDDFMMAPDTGLLSKINSDEFSSSSLLEVKKVVPHLLDSEASKIQLLCEAGGFVLAHYCDTYASNKKGDIETVHLDSFMSRGIKSTSSRLPTTSNLNAGRTGGGGGNRNGGAGAGGGVGGPGNYHIQHSLPVYNNFLGFTVEGRHLHHPHDIVNEGENPSTYPMNWCENGRLWGPSPNATIAETKLADGDIADKVYAPRESDSGCKKQVLDVRPTIPLLAAMGNLPLKIDGHFWVDPFSDASDLRSCLKYQATHQCTCGARKPNVVENNSHNKTSSTTTLTMDVEHHTSTAPELCDSCKDFHRDTYYGLAGIIGGSSMCVVLGLHRPEILELLRKCYQLLLELRHNSETTPEVWTSHTEIRKHAARVNENMIRIVSTLPKTSIRIPSGHIAVINGKIPMGALRTNIDCDSPELPGLDSPYLNNKKNASYDTSWKSTLLPTFVMPIFFAPLELAQKHGLTDEARGGGIRIGDNFKNGNNVVPLKTGNNLDQIYYANETRCVESPYAHVLSGSANPEHAKPSFLVADANGDGDGDGIGPHTLVYDYMDIGRKLPTGLKPAGSDRLELSGLKKPPVSSLAVITTGKYPNLFGNRKFFAANDINVVSLSGITLSKSLQRKNESAVVGKVIALYGVKQACGQDPVTPSHDMNVVQKVPYFGLYNSPCSLATIVANMTCGVFSVDVEQQQQQQQSPPPPATAANTTTTTLNRGNNRNRAAGAPVAPLGEPLIKPPESWGAMYGGKTYLEIFECFCEVEDIRCGGRFLQNYSSLAQEDVTAINFLYTHDFQRLLGALDVLNHFNTGIFGSRFSPSFPSRWGNNGWLNLAAISPSSSEYNPNAPVDIESYKPWPILVHESVITIDPTNGLKKETLHVKINSNVDENAFYFNQPNVYNIRLPHTCPNPYYFPARHFFENAKVNNNGIIPNTSSWQHVLTTCLTPFLATHTISAEDLANSEVYGGSGIFSQLFLQCCFGVSSGGRLSLTTPSAPPADGDAHQAPSLPDFSSVITFGLAPETTTTSDFHEQMSELTRKLYLVCTNPQANSGSNLFFTPVLPSDATFLKNLSELIMSVLNDVALRSHQMRQQQASMEVEGLAIPAITTRDLWLLTFLKLRAGLCLVRNNSGQTLKSEVIKLMGLMHGCNSADLTSEVNEPRLVVNQTTFSVAKAIRQTIQVEEFNRAIEVYNATLLHQQAQQLAQMQAIRDQQALLEAERLQREALARQQEQQNNSYYNPSAAFAQTEGMMTMAPENVFWPVTVDNSIQQQQQLHFDPIQLQEGAHDFHTTTAVDFLPDLPDMMGAVMLDNGTQFQETLDDEDGNGFLPPFPDFNDSVWSNGL